MQEGSRADEEGPLAGGAKGDGLRGGVGVSSRLLPSRSAETSTPPSRRTRGAEVGVLGCVWLAGSAKTSTAALKEAASPSRSTLVPSRLEEGEGLRRAQVDRCSGSRSSFRFCENADPLKSTRRFIRHGTHGTERVMGCMMDAGWTWCGGAGEKGESGRAPRLAPHFRATLAPFALVTCHVVTLITSLVCLGLSLATTCHILVGNLTTTLLMMAMAWTAELRRRGIVPRHSISRAPGHRRPTPRMICQAAAALTWHLTWVPLGRRGSM